MTAVTQAAPVARATTMAKTARSSSTTRLPWAWIRAVGGVAVLAVLVWQVGAGPFLDGVRFIDGPALLLASAIGVLTTVCSAWRWSLVAAGLGVRLPLRSAVAAYYRSQFLNTTLPGGVLGDVHRALRHGLDIGDVGLSVRAVVLERSAGHVAQVAVAVIVLCGFPSPVRSSMPLILAGVVAAGLLLVLMGRILARRGSNWLVRALRSAGSDIRDGLFAHRNWLGVVATSTIVLAGHLATFLLAARTAGATAPLTRLVPLTLLALLAMALPLNVAGWGPREGVAAWAFAAAGLTATQGVATAVTYGVLALVASLPGAVVLVVQWTARSRVTAMRSGDGHG
jgi:uncharacterized membrane protein YbhN (UPF0104 family)